MRLLLIATSLFLLSCHHPKWSEQHAVPQYAAYTVNGVSLTAADGQRFREILLSGRVVTDSLYRISDAIVRCRKDTDDSHSDTYSVYLNEHVIYDGDWLDARTIDLEGKEVECIQITREDAEWLKRVIPQKK
jgi:hypothetical protein